MEQFYFVLTEKCNLECSHCIRDSSPYRKETSEKNIIEQAIYNISKSYPDAHVLLTGGEPTIYNSFNDILKFSLDLGVKVIINSNGTTPFFSIKNLQMWTKYSNLSIQISLDGNEEIHNSIRGESSFKKAMQAVQNLKKTDIKCSVSSTVVNLNFFDYIDKFISSLDNFDLAHIAIKRATYAGRASSGLQMSTEEWNKKVYSLRSKQWKTKILSFPMYNFKLLENVNDESLKKLSLPDSSINCGAGTAKIYIYPSGNVCSCTCFKDFPMGNLYQDSLINIIKKKSFIKVSNNTCKECRYFHLCKGGCLGSGYQYYGEIGSPDPRCPKIENCTT